MRIRPHFSFNAGIFSKVSVRFLLVALAGILIAPGNLNAQSQASASPGRSSNPSATPPTEGIQKRDNEWGIWGGIAFHSPTLIGQTPDVHFGDVGLRYGRVLKTSKTVAFEWTIDAIPLAIISNERLIFTASPPLLTVGRKTVYGAGAAPIGLKFNFRRDRKWQPFGQATGGFLYFTDQVPDIGTSQFNFTFDFSGGVQIVNRNRRSFTIGYKYHHISNGNTGNFNPGVDVQMIFAGFSVFR